MQIEQLNLESISDDVLDECFENHNETFEEVLKQSNDDVLEEVDNVEVTDGAFNVLDSKLRLPDNLSNEMLIQRIRDGIEVKSNTLLLVRYNSGLVYGQARTCTCNIPFQDKVQYGFEGLLRSIECFDPTQNVLFSTYATNVIRTTMYNYGNDDVRLITIPRYLSVNNIKVQNYIEKYKSTNGRTPGTGEISTALGIDEGRVKRVLEFMANKPMSIDTPMSNGMESSEMTLGDVIKGTSGDYSLSEKAVQSTAQEALEAILKTLPEAEQYLISRIHGLNGHEESTFAKLEEEGLVDARGKVMKSHSTIHRRYKEILAKIRQKMEGDDISLDE